MTATGSPTAARPAQASRWSNDRMIGSTGHVKIRVGKGHPLADPKGYAYEHLVVWCAAGNPRPPKGHVLHHRNGCKTDNRLENLTLEHLGEHNRIHNAERGRDALGRFRARRTEAGRGHQ